MMAVCGRGVWFALLALWLCGAAPAAAEGWRDRFVDEQDGRFDMSDHLLQYRGALPVPIIITEPAVGAGAGAALLYFSESIVGAREKSQARGERLSVPDIGALAAFKTSNGSQGVAGGYLGTLQGDRFRFLAGAANVQLNLDYYGLRGTPQRFALDAPALVTQGLARLGESDWLLGARYIYLGAKSRFERDLPAGISLPELESRIGRASLVLDHDSRDNIFTPSRGTYVEIDIGAARPRLGGSTSFDSVFARAFHYVPLGSTAVIGFRGDGKFTRGDVPFYALPFVMLRGVPALRYQGQHAVVAESELRYRFDDRWSLVGFAGAGKAYGAAVPFAEADTVTAGGAGVRYFIARKLGMHVGVDVARGPEDTVVYLQVGSAWN